MVGHARVEHLPAASRAGAARRRGSSGCCSRWSRSRRTSSGRRRAAPGSALAAARRRRRPRRRDRPIRPIRTRARDRRPSLPPAARSMQRRGPVEVAGLQGQVRLHREARGRGGSCVGLRPVGGGDGDGADAWRSAARAVGVVPLVDGEGVVVVAHAGGVAGPAPQRHRPLARRRWPRRAGRSGSTRRPGARAARPLSAADAGRRAPARRGGTSAACVCAPDRAAARPASAGVAQDRRRSSPAPSAWWREHGGVGGRERLQRVEHPPVQRARRRAGSARRPPCGTGRGGRPRPAGPGGSARLRSSARSGGNPTPSAGSSRSGIASGAHASRCEQVPRLGVEPGRAGQDGVADGRRAARRRRGRASRRRRTGCRRSAGAAERGRRARSPTSSRDALDAQRRQLRRTARPASGPRRRAARAAGGRRRSRRRARCRPRATGVRSIRRSRKRSRSIVPWSAQWRSSTHQHVGSARSRS